MAPPAAVWAAAVVLAVAAGALPGPGFPGSADAAPSFAQNRAESNGRG